MHLERFPAYAPELNPDEQVWNHFKARLANGCPLTIDDLLDDLTHLARTTRRSPALLRSFLLTSDLPSLRAPCLSITYAAPNNSAGTEDRTQNAHEQHGIVGLMMTCEYSRDVICGEFAILSSLIDRHCDPG
ncbi:MAG: transposase [Deltaproteobacteria bacterium]|nr:transposase [Deltaproteobacteria bacterium]